MITGYCLTNYTIQCTDITTGKTGCFLFDINHYKKYGNFKAISPVFPDLVSFYKNTKNEQRQGIYIKYEGIE